MDRVALRSQRATGWQAFNLGGIAGVSLLMTLLALRIAVGAPEGAGPISAAGDGPGEVLAAVAVGALCLVWGLLCAFWFGQGSGLFPVAWVVTDGVGVWVVTPFRGARATREAFDVRIPVTFTMSERALHWDARRVMASFECRVEQERAPGAPFSRFVTWAALTQDSRDAAVEMLVRHGGGATWNAFDDAPGGRSMPRPIPEGVMNLVRGIPGEVTVIDVRVSRGVLTVFPLAPVVDREVLGVRPLEPGEVPHRGWSTHLPRASVAVVTAAFEAPAGLVPTSSHRLGAWTDILQFVDAGYGVTGSVVVDVPIIGVDVYVLPEPADSVAFHLIAADATEPPPALDA